MRRVIFVDTPAIFMTSVIPANAGMSHTRSYDSKCFWMSRPDMFPPRKVAQGMKNEAARTAAETLMTCRAALDGLTGCDGSLDD